MALTILSSNIFQFFVCIEILGIISSILVGIENNAEKESRNVLLFSKFASLLFFIAVCMIGLKVGSFEFIDIKNFCRSSDYRSLFIPAVFLVISCFCKGAQLPFSRWLIDAVKANTFVSILMHTATIVGVGVIFITKCSFIFDRFQSIRNAMIYTGIATALWMGCSALSHNNVKKIMACLTSASTGLMFVVCGIGNVSVAILYFVCHAFFKSILFLSFAYVIAAASGERNILKMGGLSKFIPKISDIIWISFLAAAGFPFCVGFFAKISFAGALQLYGSISLILTNALVNILTVSAIFRMILVSLYGSPRTDDKTLSRAPGINAYSTSSVWLLIGIAVFESFVAWSMYEWGELHFELDEMMACSRNFFDYFMEDISELAQILISIISVWVLMRYSKTRIGTTSAKVFYELFRKKGVNFRIQSYIKNTSISAVTMISGCDQKFFDILQKSLLKSLRGTQLFLSRRHGESISSHVGWIIVGIAVNFVSILMWQK
jgi:NADH:ubiquinone oxidoreductase subunit 5 (subunit L)/multisubunit Na+/H+ antiporter MnhA subunit